MKNRVHLDVRIGAENVEAALARLTAKGGQVPVPGQPGPDTWVTIADPEGNEFCLT